MTKSLVGVWQHVLTEYETSDGKTSYPRGKDAVGQLIYTPDGHMSVFIMQNNRPHFANPDFMEASDAEKVAAMNTHLSYGGRYTCLGDKVIHHVEFSSFPNRVGSDIERFVKLNGDELTLTTPPFTGKDGTSTIAKILWKQIEKIEG